MNSEFMRIRAVVFDLDGTLLNSFPAHFKAYQMTFERLGRSISQDEFLRSYSPNWYHTYEAMGLPRERWNEADQYWLEAAAGLEPELFPQVPTLLQQCSKRWAIGLVTSGSKQRVTRDLQRTGIAKYFGIIVTGDDVTSPKPSPDGLHHAMEALKVGPHETVYIGDARADFEMAHAAGVAFLGVKSDFHNHEEDSPFTPLSSVDAVLSHLKQ